MNLLAKAFSKRGNHQAPVGDLLAVIGVMLSDPESDWLVATKEADFYG